MQTTDEDGALQDFIEIYGRTALLKFYHEPDYAARMELRQHGTESFENGEKRFSELYHLV